MKCTIPEISWHNREPVLSVDFHPINNEKYKLVSSGGDCHVLIWVMTIASNGSVSQEVVSDLTRHQRAVNVVRWSPNGQYLASADDDANIIIWQQKVDDIPVLDQESKGSEIWVSLKVLRGHKEDIYDLCWSPNGLKLLSGSIDNTAILWDFQKGKNQHILSDHKGFVQGVAWDPKGQYLATLSTDRVCRIFDSSGKQVKHRISKGYLPVPEGHYLHKREVKYFHDDTFKSFFRRLHFTPEGTLLVTPSGRIETEDSKEELNATYIFVVDSWSQPAAILPRPKQSSTVVRCCPVLFELREDCSKPVISLPYRMVIAVGTDHDIILYDTQQMAPFAYFRNVHYTRLTDLTWSSDGRLLVASSTDGFCSLVTFDVEEIGKVYVKEESETEENNLDVSVTEETIKDENINANKKAKEVEVITNKKAEVTEINTNKKVKEVEVNTDKKEKEVEVLKNKRPSFLEQWTQKASKKLKASNVKSISTEAKEKTDISSNVIEISDDDNDSEIKGANKTTAEKCEKEVINKLIPRRIVPIKVSNNCDNKSSNIQQKNSSEVQQEKNCTQTKTIRRITPIHIESRKVKKVQKSKTVEQRNIKKTLNKKITKHKKNFVVKKPFVDFLKPKDVKFKKRAAVRTQLFEKSQDTDRDCTLIEDDMAQDAWKCETKSEIDAKTQQQPEVSAGSSKENQSDDDITEDFCLQIEDSKEGSQQKQDGNTDSSQTECNSEIKQNHVKSGEVTENKITEDDGSRQKQNIDSVSSQTECNSRMKQNKENLVKSETLTEEVSENKTDLKNEVNKLIAKSKLNRIPLITLSSPKSKKKEEPSNVSSQ